MSRQLDEHLAACIAAKGDGSVVSREVAMGIAAAWMSPADRLAVFATGGPVMREMVGIVDRNMKDLCALPGDFDADDSVKDLGTVPQNLVLLHGLREYLQSVLEPLVYEEHDLESFGNASVEEWSDGRAMITWRVDDLPYGKQEIRPDVSTALGELAAYVEERLTEEAEQEREERELAASESPSA